MTEARARRGRSTPGSTAAAGREDDPFEEMFRAHRHQVFAFCRRRLSHVQDAEDSVQETFSRAWWALHRGAEPDDLRAWLFTIAAHACHKRYAERAQLPLGAPRDLIGVEWHRATPRFEDQLIERLDSTLANAVARLAPTDRSILALTHGRGMPISAVAHELGIPPRRVEASLFRTRRALRDQLR